MSQQAYPGRNPGPQPGEMPAWVSQTAWRCFFCGHVQTEAGRNRCENCMEEN